MKFFKIQPKRQPITELIQEQLLYRCKKITSEIELGIVIDYIGVKVTVVKYHQYIPSVSPGIWVNWFDKK